MIESMYQDLAYWIQERELVATRKALGEPKPWSDDPIFQSTRFTNVRREDDKVTIWIKENWRDPYRLDPNLAFGMCLARVVNLPETLEALGFPTRWSPTEFIDTIARLGAGGRKVWTSAYMVTGGYSEGGESKQQIMARVLDKAYVNAAKIKKGDTLQTASDILQLTPGLGTFLAAQVVADLKYTPLLAGAVDKWTYCAPGPGSTMGLNFLHGRDRNKSIGEKQFQKEVNDLADKLMDDGVVVLDAHDTQNCLCEFSKYIRIRDYGGRAKTGYPGR